MKIGDEVYVHGFVDEIRGDTVIITNKGGYFGTCKEEVISTHGYDRFDFSTDKYSVVVHEDTIHVFNKKIASVIVDFGTEGP